MRTKTLLLSAAIGAAGVASAMAQGTVYSVNIVGYINLSIPPRLSMIANQLDATPDNTLPNVLGAPTGILSISKFNPAAGNFDTSIFDPDVGVWSNTAMQLNPGEGAFADNDVNNGGNINVTLVGQVRLNSSIQFVPGLKVISSVIPQAGPITPDLGFPAPPSGQFSLSKFNRTTGAFDTYLYDEDAGGWAPSVPALAIGESVFTDLAPGAPSFSWDRNFVVGQ
jgi:hypothetical protein